MAIRIKRVNSANDAYYKLNESVNNNDTGGKKTASSASEVFSKLTKYSKNILKSTKNLAFDVINANAPELAEVKETIKDVYSESTEDLRKQIGEIVELGRKRANSKSSSASSIKEKISETIKEQKKNILDRLKSGNLYMSDQEKIDAQMSAEFGGGDDFNMDFGDFGGDFGGDFESEDKGDTFVTTDGEDILPDEPFSAPVRKGAVTRTNVSAKRRQRARKSNVKRPSSGRKKGTVKFVPSSTHVGEVRLGDELISQTASEIGNQIIYHDEELWARTNEAENRRFSKLIGYQTSIVTSLNSIVDFNVNVVSEQVKSQLEYQEKQIAAKQDELSILKELKDTMLAVGTYKSQTKDIESVLDGTRINTKSYSKQIKQNASEMMYSMGLGGLSSVLGLAPTLLDDNGLMGGGPKFDPMNSLIGAIPKLLMSRGTRAKFKQFNNNLSNFGGMFIGKMNELAEYGTGFGKTIGKLFGVRSTQVSQANLGLKNPNQVVGWTAKSDRSINEVIPAFLAKIYGSVSGIGNTIASVYGVDFKPEEEIYYNYKDGRFQAKSSMQKAFKQAQKMAYTNDTIKMYENQMFANAVDVDEKGNLTDTNMISAMKVAKQKAKKNGEEFDFDEWKSRTSKGLKDALETINTNIVKRKIPLDYVRLSKPGSDGGYSEEQKMILAGIPEELQSLALGTFLTGLSTMTSSERDTLNAAGYMNAAMNVQKNMNAFSKNTIENGGAAVLGDIAVSEEIKEHVRSFDTNKNIMIDENALMTDRANTMRMGNRAVELKTISDLIDAYGGVEQAKKINKDVGKFLDKHPDLVQESLDLRQEQIVKYKRQDMIDEARSNAMLDALRGGAFAGNKFDKGMSGFVDFANGMYSNFFGSRGPEGKGLIYGNYGEGVNDVYYKSSREMLEKFMESNIGQKLDKTSKGALGKAIGKMQENLDYQINNSVKGDNKFRMENFDQIENPLLRDIARYGRAAYNTYIMNTGVGEKYNSFGEMNSGIFENTRRDMRENSMNREHEEQLRQSGVGVLAEVLYNANNEKLYDSVLSVCYSNGAKSVASAKFGDNKLDKIKIILEKMYKNKRLRDRIIAALAKENVFSKFKGAPEMRAKLANYFKEFRQKFATGAEQGRVIGASGGDQTTIQVNGDEMVLTKKQQNNIVKTIQEAAAGTYSKAKGVFKSTTSGVSIKVSHLVDSLRSVGVRKTMEIYSDEIKKDPHVKDIINKVSRIPELAKSFGSDLDEASGGDADLEARAGVSIRDFCDSLDRVGVENTLKMFGSRILEFLPFKKLVENYKRGKISKDYAGYGNTIQFGFGKFRNRTAGAIGGALTAAGTYLGGSIGGIPGAIIGGKALNTVGKSLTYLLKQHYPKLKGSLLAAGYADAPTMKPADLFALITNMAESSDPIERDKGQALMTTDEYEKLRHKVLDKTHLQQLFDFAVKKPAKFIKNRLIDAKLMFRRTIRYKNVVNVLRERFKNEFDVTNYDKEGLYALIQSLPEKTEADKKFKSSIMQMDHYKKLDKDIANWRTVGEAVRDSVQEIPKKIVRGIRFFKLFKYRNLVKLYENMEGVSSKDAYDTIREPGILLGLIESWNGSPDEKKQRIYNIVKSQKIFQKLELEANKDKPAELEKIKQKHETINSNKRRYSGLISILNNCWDGDPKDRPDYMAMNKDDLYLAALSVVKKGDDLGKALFNSHQFQLLEKEAGHRDFDKRQRDGGMLNKLKAFINRKTNKNIFKVSDGYTEDQEFMNQFGDSAKWSPFDKTNKENRRRIKKAWAESRRMFDEDGKRLKGAARREKAMQLLQEMGGVIEEDSEQKFAYGGVVKGPRAGDTVGIKANGGETVLTENQSKGIWNRFKSIFGGKDQNQTIMQAALNQSAKSKVSSDIAGQYDSVLLKAGKRAGPYAAMISALSRMIKIQSATLKVLGGNDKGEIDEHNKETIAGQINGIEGNGSKNKKKQNKKSKNKEGNWFSRFWNNLSNGEKGVKNILGSKGAGEALGGAAMAVMAATGIANSAVSTVKRAKEDGVLTALTTRESTTHFNADGTRKTETQEALDRAGDMGYKSVAMYGKRMKDAVVNTGKAAWKATVGGGLGKTIAHQKNLISKFGVKGFLKNTGRNIWRKNVTHNVNAIKNAGKTIVKKAVDFKDILTHVFKKITEKGAIKKLFGKMINKVKSFFGDIAKRIGGAANKAAGKEIAEKVAKEASSKAVEKTAKQGTKSALGTIPGIGTIAALALVIGDAVLEAVEGYNTAGRTFGIDEKDVTKKMKWCAAIVKAIKSVAFGIWSLIPGVGLAVTAIVMAIEIAIPDDWLIKSTYKLFADDKEIEKLEKDQDFMNDQATKRNIDDKDKLVEWSNRSLGEKAADGIRRGWGAVKAFFGGENDAQKKIDARDAKKLGKEFLDENGNANEKYYEFKKDYNKDYFDKENAEPFRVIGWSTGKTHIFYRTTDGKIYDDYGKLKFEAKDIDKHTEKCIKILSSKNISKSDIKKLQDSWEIVLQFGSLEQQKSIMKAAKARNSDSPYSPTSKIYLNSDFLSKWYNFEADPELRGIPLKITATKRPIATQMAYFAKNRVGKTTNFHEIATMAGIPNGAGFWGIPTDDDNANQGEFITKTLQSAHLGGNALDINTANLSREQLSKLGSVAKKYGIDWGGSWTNFKDEPHFQLPDNQVKTYAAFGGIIKGKYNSFGDKVHTMLNPGEMVLNKVQQSSLLNRINKWTRKDYGDENAHTMARLNESPLLTNTKNELKDIQEAINIQRQIYNEQVRHNEVAENFFKAVLAAMSFSKLPNKQKASITEISQDDISGLIRGASKLAVGM